MGALGGGVMKDKDLVCYITVADACRRLHMRATDGRAWLRAHALVVRVVIPGRPRPVERVSLGALSVALEAPAKVVIVKPRSRSGSDVKNWDALHPRNLKSA